jgi:hypothetical protein
LMFLQVILNLSPSRQYEKMAEDSADFALRVLTLAQETEDVRSEFVAVDRRIFDSQIVVETLRDERREVAARLTELEAEQQGCRSQRGNIAKSILTSALPEFDRGCRPSTTPGPSTPRRSEVMEPIMPSIRTQGPSPSPHRDLRLGCAEPSNQPY